MPKKQIDPTFLKVQDPGQRNIRIVMCGKLPKEVIEDRIFEIKREAPQAYNRKRPKFNQIKGGMSGCTDSINGDGLSQWSDKVNTVAGR